MGGNNDSTKLDVQSLWAKYEDIAMHFNELLLQLRLRSLAGIAAVSTLVGFFADNANSNLSLSWIVAAGLFVVIGVVWIAIFCLDFFYYGKLLTGAVTALTELEAALKDNQPVTINLSTLVEEEIVGKKPVKASKGVLSFYGLVLALIVAGAIFSLRMAYIEARDDFPTTQQAQTQP